LLYALVLKRAHTLTNGEKRAKDQQSPLTIQLNQGPLPR
jgi:hypothetical protein